MRAAQRLAQEVKRRQIGKDALRNAFLYTNKAGQTSSSGSISRKNDALPLQDWPISVKDTFCTLELPTACSSKMLLDYMSPIEATSVKLLREAGANIVAKTNCDEFGMGSANIFSVHGQVLNPHSDESAPRVAGGSSGGAAAGVACKASRIALASDTGGSIRIPAAYCGVYGLKPSYGLISRWGLVAYADSLDTVGLMGSNVADIKAAFNIISRYDNKDSTSISEEYRRKACDITRRSIESIMQAGGGLEGLRIGVPIESFPLELSEDALPAFRDVLSNLKSRGAEIVSVGLPSTLYALSAYYVLASAEASSNLARYDGVRYGHRAQPRTSNEDQANSISPTAFHRHISQTRSEGFGEEVKKRILLGTYSLTSDLFDNYFLQAQNVRKLIRQDFDRTFRIPNLLASNNVHAKDSSGVDILISPSAVGIAPTISEAENMGIKAYTQDLLTVPASLAGVPALSIPVAKATDMPIGVTLTSQWGTEELLFAIAESLPYQASTIM